MWGLVGVFGCGRSGGVRRSWSTAARVKMAVVSGGIIAIISVKLLVGF